MAETAPAEGICFLSVFFFLFLKLLISGSRTGGGGSLTWVRERTVVKIR
jgi:hypothetical protein